MSSLRISENMQMLMDKHFDYISQLICKALRQMKRSVRDEVKDLSIPIKEVIGKEGFG